jgi:P pilus assembly chaperone PapD
MRFGLAAAAVPAGWSWRPFAPALAVTLLLLSTPGPAHAQGIGDLAVAPTRIILEGRERTAQVSLLNKGSVPATYRISIINMQMTESGEYRRIEETGVDGGYADALVRYAPRQVELAPGKSQTVRIILRKPGGLKEGEYRSHILFQAVPDPTAGQSVEATTTEQGLSIRLIVVPAITIPLIVRHGKLEATASLSDLQLVAAGATPDAPPALAFRINRSGARSVFGDISIAYHPPGSKEEYIIGEINQLAVYTPNAHRRVTMPLHVPEHVKLAGGRIAVQYRAHDDTGKGKLLATAELKLP